MAASVHAPQHAVLQIEANKVVARVSPNHAGLMTEEINHSFDGGLYAELVRDRALTVGIQPKAGALGAWTVIDQLSAAGLALDVTNSLSEALPGSLRIDAPSASPGHRVGIANGGFWGIPVHPSTSYRLSFYGKALREFSGPLQVSIESPDGATTYARTEIPLLPGPWKKYETVLKTTSLITPTADARLVISTEHPGTFLVNLVSLFPPTWKDRPNGTRVDLMQKLADLHPKFLRFPGGSYLASFEWKKTIGALIERPGNSNAWGYPSSYGMGYLEFLEWCEDLGMEPVLGVKAGDLQTAAGSALQPLVQDALDEIEYATGATTTRWGARRVQDGHPEPFKLHYVEVGNEEEGPSYDARFAQFYDAIKARYPAIQLIASSLIVDTANQHYVTTQVKSRVPDVLDDHFYLKVEDAFSKADQYDHYDRGGPKIFVGEWATVEGSPTSNMLAALGDAAWMTGMERNSDVVVMQAYAPLFVNVNKEAYQWSPNLIGYDALNSYCSPSYYAQLMFNTYRGDEVIASTFKGLPRLFFSVTKDSTTGTINVKAVNASRFSHKVEIRITGGGVELEAVGKVVELTGEPRETNSIQAPTKIVPVERSLNGVGTTFEHMFPRYSVTVLELRAR